MKNMSVHIFHNHNLALDAFEIFYWIISRKILLTCPKGFGLKLAKLGLKTPLKNKVKQKPSQAKLSQAKPI